MTDDIEKIAKDYFATGYNCAQAVLRTVLEHKGLYFNEAPMVAAGFGGGISRRGEICGTLTGAIMAIGVIHEQTIDDRSELKAATYKSTAELIEKFSEIHDTPICNELVGFDMTNPDARQKGNDEGIFSTICPKFVVDAVKIVIDLFP
ncbi:MAG: C_GCAxxG_C_C family protein [Candidatus Heimdallarchaeota archaeon]